MRKPEERGIAQRSVAKGDNQFRAKLLNQPRLGAYRTHDVMIGWIGPVWGTIPITVRINNYMGAATLYFQCIPDHMIQNPHHFYFSDTSYISHQQSYFRDGDSCDVIFIDYQYSVLL